VRGSRMVCRELDRNSTDFEIELLSSCHYYLVLYNIQFP
jgi:hypothetical protein